ncbi:MAG: hypothetical protein QMD85_03530, partial [Candidatus Aenigmarchaeota archaeon]|nr:hypothetical protein [Candidatus Aenigmarchaeota archaeon]
MASNRNILLAGTIVLILIISTGIIYVQSQPRERSYSVPPPEEVVRQYFESWNRKDWTNMYATLSDDFKKIDPDAKDMAAFRNFAGSQGIEGVRIISINEESND